MIQVRRFRGDIGSQLLSQFRVVADCQLLCVAGDGSERITQLERHLGGHFAAQGLLASNLRHLGLIIDQARGAQYFAGRRMYRRHRDLEDALLFTWSHVSKRHLLSRRFRSQAGLDCLRDVGVRA